LINQTSFESNFNVSIIHMQRLQIQTLHPRNATPGFALIATISIMVLLALIAVGILSLSSITIRSAGTDNAQSCQWPVTTMLVHRTKTTSLNRQRSPWARQAPRQTAPLYSF